MAIRTSSEIVFACHSAACRPPTSGGTGGSSSSGGSKYGNKRKQQVQQITAERARAAYKAGAPASGGLSERQRRYKESGDAVGLTPHGGPKKAGGDALQQFVKYEKRTIMTEKNGKTLRITAVDSRHDGSKQVSFRNPANGNGSWTTMKHGEEWEVWEGQK